MNRTFKIAILVLLPFLVGCRTPVSPETQFRHRLQSIILPHVDFREADIRDVALSAFGGIPRFVGPEHRTPT
ncbi:MAG: hypothetical protein KKG09_08255 [Verrucomicrobia bacterium]|nr:hypothetical protein [Verrucomicrobiota bacterium]MBU4290895.1 hypothetical protein [Verrucomicrobiota bacterium]MBU4428121.1 hypothetical protein [Verrucomicrobiota bacterium]MBU4497980.1 hypothetical protein [Verrucomicrobiota bacterium]MCG2679073.1 hypothetical protein [Kiritimatiellia bacterium]